MTPKEKAEQLFGKFYELPVNHATAKDSALIAVDEILKASPSKPVESDNGSYSSDIIESIEYWQQVKQEIQNL